MTGQEFRNYRTSFEMSQTELAEKLGLTRRTLTRIEQAERIPLIYEYAIKGLNYEQCAT